MRLARDMPCNEIVELITEYLEGGLSASERERFEEHIGFCDWCLSYLDQMRQTIEMTGELRAEDVPPGLQERLMVVFREWQAG
jgi:predicted anti-sigma-YlaC factor YlaD